MAMPTTRAAAINPFCQAGTTGVSSRGARSWPDWPVYIAKLKGERDRYRQALERITDGEAGFQTVADVQNFALDALGVPVDQLRPV